MGTTRGELRKLGREGKITTDIIIEAIRNAKGEIDERFGRTQPTIGQGFIILRNNFLELIGAFNESTKAIEKFVKLLTSVASSLHNVSEFIKEYPNLISNISAGLLALGAAFTLAWGGRRLQELIRYTTATKDFYQALAQGNVTANSALLKDRTSAVNRSHLSALAAGTTVE